MAKLPVPVEQLIERFGPHPKRVPAGGWAPIGEPDRLVKTHCCFCGQQCGIQLKVKDNRVVGFEPWEDFPFNQGKLCPKGVKRYMQDEHPDRLRSPLERVDGAGFRELGWDAALDRCAREIRRIQEAHGRDAFALLTGASLTNERAYLMGKFARVALRTANIDYNGRLCMVSAGAASKKVFGIDRAANPWSDLPKAEVILIAGANVAECAPITTEYLWQARENGAKIIVLDPRMTPIARTVDLFIPVKPGGDIGVFNGMLHVMIERGWIDRAFVDAHTTGFDAVAETIGCSNCVLACPFGVPRYLGAIDQMMKCDYCYDRTSTGKRPMCATVCPSQALSFITPEQFERTRRGHAVNEWIFGDEVVRTKVAVVVPREVRSVRADLVQVGRKPAAHVDDVAALLEVG